MVYLIFTIFGIVLFFIASGHITYEAKRNREIRTSNILRRILNNKKYNSNRESPLKNSKLVPSKKAYYNSNPKLPTNV